MHGRTLPIRRWLIATLGGLYNDLIGRRAHLGAAAVIFDRGGRVLLVRHSYGRRGWELPGGGRRAKESLQQAVLREIREELGVEALRPELRAVYYEPGVDQHHFAFRCQLPDGLDPKPRSAEILECGYWPVDALPRPINDFTIQRIRDAQSNEPRAVQVLGPRQWFT
ncbi:MAG: NUDIX domain-containing protein [Candidatus Dormibacteraeota bacterium]|nr:NUDIX domain-containing protein [Candidatus Dormibacteraeota bacterium]